MPEIFRFTQLRQPTGINIDEVRLKHIPFFKHIESVKETSIYRAFSENFEKGIEESSVHMEANEGFKLRTKNPSVIINNEKWDSSIFGSQIEVFLKLSFLLSQVNSDKKENKNKELFAQISKILIKLNDDEIQAVKSGFPNYFGDLLVLYFNSSKYPDYLRFLTRLRRWQYVLIEFALADIINELSTLPDTFDKLDTKSALHFLINAKILLPANLFIKSSEHKPKPSPQNPKDIISSVPFIPSDIKTDIKSGSIVNIKTDDTTEQEVKADIKAARDIKVNIKATDNTVSPDNKKKVATIKKSKNK